ncbi:TPA: TIGR00289 family protein [Candidatus Bathyarchaeota archaeon]|nr:TIGR00289 family protein [Candidatus Bathyarchaeota archaeon]
MKLAALFSGGKDSTYAAYLAEKGGHEVSIFACMRPARGDSYMFHGVNIHLTPLVAEAQGKPLASAPSSGEKEKEVEELKHLIELLDVKGVVSGAIASKYQRDRVNQLCSELGIIHLSPLWGKNPQEVLEAEIKSGMEIILVHAAANGLDKSWLGRRIDKKAAAELAGLSERFGVNVCGEGGEYESLVVDAPWFRKRLVIDEAEVVWEGTSGTYAVKHAHLAPKAHKG